MSEPRPQRTLAWQLARWMAASTLAGLAVFAVVAYVVVIALEMAEEERDPPNVIAREARNEVGIATLVAAPIGLLLAGGAAFLLTRRALAPIDAAVDAAAQLGAHELHRRLPVPETEGEVRALVLALNELLSRLETGFAALSRYAADASHELRTPLTVIATELEVSLQRPRTPAEWELAAQTCLAETRHLSALVEGLLEMARTEGAPTLRREAVSVQAVVGRVVGLHAARAKSRDVEVRAAGGDETDSLVAADPDALASALSNVVGNAVEHTPRGGEVVVSWARGPGASILLHVDDTGAGVAPDERERIFAAFDRGSAPRSRSGLGLGLAIARRVVERQGGTIGVGDSPKGGARFTLELAAFTEA